MKVAKDIDDSDLKIDKRTHIVHLYMHGKNCVLLDSTVCSRYVVVHFVTDVRTHILPDKIIPFNSAGTVKKNSEIIVHWKRNFKKT